MWKTHKCELNFSTIFQRTSEKGGEESVFAKVINSFHGAKKNCPFSLKNNNNNRKTQRKKEKGEEEKWIKKRVEEDWGKIEDCGSRTELMMNKAKSL